MLDGDYSHYTYGGGVKRHTTAYKSRSKVFVPNPLHYYTLIYFTEVLRETEKALLLSFPLFPSQQKSINEQWFPKSMLKELATQNVYVQTSFLISVRNHWKNIMKNKINNLVAKNSKLFNKPKVFVDRKKQALYIRAMKHKQSYEK
jgi:hypothetical protein